GPPAIADKGYRGAGIGIHHPAFPRHHGREADPHINTRTRNALIRGLRGPGERAIAQLKQRWRALQHVTLSPERIGAIAQAALALNNAWKS
ncbi:transposase family protein, partial [Yinghuangia seranimata]|uniref:transposase family protein n=1 Tax=Yinghuangia seranimata TaxID=408067 RepID=UPI00248B0E56